MKVTKPIKIMHLTHKQTGEVLELETGEEALVNTPTQSYHGIVEQISYDGAENFIILETKGSTKYTIYLEDIITIGEVILEDYDIRIDGPIGDYELELHQGESPIMLSKGDIVEVAYKNSDLEEKILVGILDNLTTTSISINIYSTIHRALGTTVIPAGYLYDIKVIKKAEDNNNTLEIQF